MTPLGWLGRKTSKQTNLEDCCAWACGILSVTRLFVNFACAPAKTRLSLHIRAVWSGSSLCTLWKEEPRYPLCGRWWLLSGCADPRADLGLRLHLIFVWCSRHSAPHHVTFPCATSSMSIFYYILKKPWWRNIDVNTWFISYWCWFTMQNY